MRDFTPFKHDDPHDARRVRRHWYVLALALQAFFLPAAFADINIDKNRSVYYC